MEATCWGKSASQKQVGGCCYHPERDGAAWRGGSVCGDRDKGWIWDTCQSPFLSVFQKT